VKVHALCRLPLDECVCDLGEDEEEPLKDCTGDEPE
jgi:hypothetical protein